MIEWVRENYPEVLLMDGYDDCIVGVTIRFGAEPIVCYAVEAVLARLRGSGMTHDEAVEWFEFNQIGAWVGEKTPCFLVVPGEEE